ncbi:unannotated protein [freshwater metagenome]|uniref:Unannotated protein n=1 Tax=freshwater metagenome TaxID=449393 RepID=A0A6J6QUA7_9ZZZZ
MHRLDAHVVVGVNRAALEEEERPAAELTALGDQDAVGLLVRRVEPGGDPPGRVLDVGRRVLGQPSTRARVEGQRARRQLATAELGDQPLQEAVVERQDVVLLRLGEEERLQLGQPLGVIGGDVAGLGPVRRGVVELPAVLVERRQLDLTDGPRRAVLGDGGPAFVVDPAVAVHLEVLRHVLLGRGAVAQARRHRGALDRVLRDAVDRGGVRQSGDLEDRRGDVDDVVPLVPHRAGVGDAGRPVHDEAVAGAAVVGGDLLGPLVGRVHGQCPADVVVRVRRRPADVVELLEDAVGRVGQAVETQHLVERALDAALAGGAVVAEDVEDDGVVELAEPLDLVDEAADLLVGVLGERRVDLHQPLGDAPVVVGQVVPVRGALRPRRQLGPLGHQPQRLLSGQGLVALLVPPVAEVAAEPVASVARHVERSVRGAEGHVGEPRPIRVEGAHASDPGDGLIDDVLGEVVALGLGGRRVDVGGAFDEVRHELVGLAPEEAVELLEALVGRPVREGTGRRHLGVRCLVHLAEGSGRVAVEVEGACQRRLRRGAHGVVPRGVDGEIGDRAHPDAVVVASGQQRAAGR